MVDSRGSFTGRGLPNRAWFDGAVVALAYGSGAIGFVVAARRRSGWRRLVLVVLAAGLGGVAIWDVAFFGGLEVLFRTAGATVDRNQDLFNEFRSRINDGADPGETVEWLRAQLGARLGHEQANGDS